MRKGKSQCWLLRLISVLFRENILQFHSCNQSFIITSGKMVQGMKQKSYSTIMITFIKKRVEYDNIIIIIIKCNHNFTTKVLSIIDLNRIFWFIKQQNTRSFKIRDLSTFCKFCEATFEPAVQMATGVLTFSVAFLGTLLSFVHLWRTDDKNYLFGGHTHYAEAISGAYVI